MKNNQFTRVGVAHSKPILLADDILIPTASILETISANSKSSNVEIIESCDKTNINP